MTTLSEKVSEVLQGRAQFRGYTYHSLQSSNGVRYPFISLCSGGVKQECESTLRYDSQTLAERDYAEVLEAYLRLYAKLPETVIYWREGPTIIADDDGMCFVYSRLLAGPQRLVDFPR
jgi:hypothetical protein